MRPAHEANVTTIPHAIGAPDPVEPRATGVWTLADGRPIIAEPEGPATILVPSEQVRLLAVDLPLPSRAKRLAALPFAIEDLIAEPVDAVHIALGGELSPGRYLVGVVGHEAMTRWVAAAEEAGLGSAAMVPDALALPRPGEGEWAVDLSGARALVRAGDGTGFAMPAAMLQPAWVAAARPKVLGYGAPLPAEMAAEGRVHDLGVLAAPALDLRQGAYALRRAGFPNLWRRLGWIVALGAAAHIVIALGDTLMLRTIADRREADTRALVASLAPGAALGEDVAGAVADMLPRGGGTAPQVFLPLLNRVSGALAPVGGLSVRNLGFEGNVLTMDLDGTDSSLPARIDAALKAARVGAQVTRAANGSIRITASAA